MKSSIAYVLAIIIANLGFTHIPLIELPFDQKLAPMSFLVGFIFVLRDYAQRDIGNRVYLLMLIGVLLSYVMADPYVALASAVAFGVSELIDAFIYTVTRRPMRDRILYSSIVSTPTDSAIFMLILGFFSWIGLVIMVASKMIGALIVWKFAR